MVTGGGYYQQKEVKRGMNKMSNKQTEERLERANQLLDDIAEGEYGETLEDSIQWRIVKYFDDIAKEDEGYRYNLIKQRVDRENYKIGWKKKDNEK